MNALMQSQIFFFISSIGFIVLGVLVGILLFYLVRISQTFSRIIDKAEADINSIGDTTKEILSDIRESTLFQFLNRFLKKKKTTKRTKVSS